MYSRPRLPCCSCLLEGTKSICFEVFMLGRNFLFACDCQVNISGECRERILATDVTAFNIFDEARKEVLTVMEVRWRLGYLFGVFEHENMYQF